MGAQTVPSETNGLTFFSSRDCCRPRPIKIRTYISHRHPPLDIRLTRDRAEKNYSIHKTKKNKTTELETIARFALFYWLGTFGDFKKKNFFFFLEGPQKKKKKKKKKKKS